MAVGKDRSAAHLSYRFFSSSSGQQPDLPGVDVLLPLRAGAGVPADRLAALQARGGVPGRHPLHHHSDAPVAEERGGHAGHAVLLRGGDGQRGGLLLLHLQVTRVSRRGSKRPR